MSKWVFGLLLLWPGLATVTDAQQPGGRVTVSGTVIDGADKSPVMQATVQLLSLPDSTMATGFTTDTNGGFRLSAKPGKYVLAVSFIGYTTVRKPVMLSAARPNLPVGQIELHEDAIMLEGATVTAQAPEVTASGDTLVYNSSAYRLPEGSALEALVKKLPGADVDENGKITINGKEVKKIMVDGKEFFADDPNIAMKNLPVNIIDKIRAYEKQSDMARVTGIEDGEEETVLDLTVKPGMNQGWFGNLDVAAGNEDRYSGKMMLNRFVNRNQLTVIGSTNNVNDNDFPGGGGGPRWNRMNGLNAIRMAGINFATETKTWKTEGSLKYNYQDADLQSRMNSETSISGESSSFKNALNIQRNKTTNFAGDFRIEWNPDTMTTLIARPRFSYDKGNNANTNRSFTFNADPQHSTDELLAAGSVEDLVSADKVINVIQRNSLGLTKNINAGGSVMVNRRLGKAGRNITLRAQYSYANNKNEQLSTSSTEYYQQGDSLAIVNRYITSPVDNSNYGIRLSYSEPIFRGAYLQFSYNFQGSHSQRDNNTFDMDDQWTVPQGFLPGQGILNTSLSKSATYDYYNHQMDLSMRYMREKIRLSVGVSFQPQHTTLAYKQNQLDTIAKRNVFNFTPTLDFRYSRSKSEELRVRYRGRSSQPSMTNLLPITDDSDPLNVQKGNPGLKPSFTNSLEANYNSFNTDKQRGIMARLNYENVLNSISNRRVYNESTGGYTTTPENINGNWNIFGMLGFNTALPNKKFTVSTFTFSRYNNMVSYISSREQMTESDKNKTRQLNLNERLRGTYRNDWFEFSLNGSFGYSHSRNSFQSQNNMDTYEFSYGASTNIRLPWNMSIATDMAENSRRGYSDPNMNRNELIWNAQLSQDFLKGNAATVSLQLYDILRQQSNISRTMSAAMRQDTEYNAIFSYGMIHFIYRLNLFGGKGARGGDRPGGPGFGGPGRGPGGGPGGFGGGRRRF